MTYINKLFFWGCLPWRLLQNFSQSSRGECQVFVQHPKYRSCVKAEEQKEGASPCGLPAQTQLLGILASTSQFTPDVLFFFLILCVSVLRVSFCVCYFPHSISFLNFAYKDTASASFFLCCWLHLQCDPQRTILVGTLNWEFSGGFMSE